MQRFSRQVGALAALCGALMLVPAPARAADREHQQIMADIRMLQEQTLQLQLLLTSLDRAMQNLSDKFDQQAEATVRAFADQRLVAENVGADVRILREKLDDTGVRIVSLSQEVEALRVTIPTLITSLAAPALDPTTGEPVPASTDFSAFPAAPVPSPLAPGISPQRMFDTAMADYMAGQWNLAAQGFEAYIEAFPRSERTDDAQFQIGQTYFAEGRFREAITAFEQVLLNYPDGDVVPEASYKRGLALEELGEVERARQAFELVVQNYPDSPMATLAQQTLNRLDRPEP